MLVLLSMIVLEIPLVHIPARHERPFEGMSVLPEGDDIVTSMASLQCELVKECVNVDETTVQSLPGLLRDPSCGLVGLRHRQW